MSHAQDLPTRRPATSPVVEPSIPSKRGRVRRGPVRIRAIMVAVVWCALLLSLHRANGVEWLPALLVLTLGPICGAIAQRCWGGRGILGGVIGGMVSSIGLGVVGYLWAYLYPEPHMVDYVGPGLTFIILSSYGAVVGLAAGILAWGVSLVAGASDKE
jgi:hypothetical protein